MSTEKIAPEVFLTYYRRLYPFKSLFNWLNHEHQPTRLFTHREFAFTLPGDVYLRYHSFNDADDLKKQVCSLNPERFEIGPVYNAKPKDKKTLRKTQLTPLQRELVFDIDMTDYDPVRLCCAKADICLRCWAFISAAVKVLHSALQEEFGFKQLMWVYSGRRGIHLWISDKEAMELTDGQRKAIVGFLTVVPSSAKGKINVRIGSRPLPPSLQNALDTLKERFMTLIVNDQDLFIHKHAWETLLEHLPANAANELRDIWTKDVAKDSADKWEDIRSQAIKSGKSGSQQRAAMQAAMEDIILQYTYPRLDAEVSKHRNHLLKAPFCIHPKTGRVCVPVDPETIDEFDPEKVPTVQQLLDEIDSFTSEAGAEHHSDWEKTSLKPYVDMLDKFTAGLMNEVRREKRAADTTW